MTFKKILFPVDSSDRCRVAAPFVCATARRFGATVTLANYVETPPVWYGAAEVPVIPDPGIPYLLENAQMNLTFFGGEFFQGVPTEIVVQQGDPGAKIVELVRNSGIDLIMMPTHGRGVFRAALLGSVTAKVLHDTEIPVWTSAHGDTFGPAASTEWRSIVCSVDTTPDAIPLMRFASGLAEACSATVHLVHAIPSPPEAGPERYFERDFDTFLRDSARSAVENMQKEAGQLWRLD